MDFVRSRSHPALLPGVLNALLTYQHRDLHEGQILISPSPISPSSSIIDCLSESQTGVNVTIIDFGLSRLSIPGKTSSTWSDLPPEVYEGKGDQWDVYRSMKDQIAGDWAGFHPETNVLVRGVFIFTRSTANRIVAPLYRPIPSQSNNFITTTPSDPSDT